MNRSFVRVVAAAALTVAATSCSTGNQVRNSSLDECCQLVQADPPPPDANELVFCDNKGKNDLVDKNVKNDDKGKHVCGVKVGNWTKEQSMVVWLIVLPIVLAVIAALVLPATRRRRPRTTA